MTFNFDHENNTIVNLASFLSAGATTCNVDPGFQDLIPNGVQNTLATLEEIDADGNVTRREGITITNRSGGSLTIVRAVQSMPESDTANTHTQVSYDFDPSNGARIGLYWTKLHAQEIRQDIEDLNNALTNDYLTKTEHIEAEFIKGASSTGNDDYQISIPEVLAYSDLQTFTVKFDVANTADATFEVNALGQKAIVKGDDEALVTGDISAGFVATVTYDATLDKFRMTSPVADLSSTVAVENLKKDYVLGEDITAGDKAGYGFIGDGQEIIENISNNDIQFLGNVATNEKVRIKIDKDYNTTTFDFRESGSQIITTSSPFIETTGQKYTVDRDGFIKSITLNLSRSVVASAASFVGLRIRDGFEGSNPTQAQILADSTNSLQVFTLPLGPASSSFTFDFTGLEVTEGDLLYITLYDAALPSSAGTVGYDTSTTKTYEFGQFLQNGSPIDATIRGSIEYGEYPKSNHLYSFSIVADKVGAPVDDILFDLFEDGDLVSADNTLQLLNADIDWTSKTILTGRAWFSNRQASSRYIEIRRSWALDPVNYFTLAYNNAFTIDGLGFDVFNWSIWVPGTGLLNFNTTWGFEQNKMYLSDQRDIESYKTNGVIVSSGLEGETKSFYTQWSIPSIGSVWDILYIDTSSWLWKVSDKKPFEQSGFVVWKQDTTWTLSLQTDKSLIEWIVFGKEFDQFTFSIGTTTTAIITYSHSLWRIPRRIRFAGWSGSITTEGEYQREGQIQKCYAVDWDDPTPGGLLSQTKSIVYFDASDTTDRMDGQIISLSDSTITIRWTRVSATLNQTLRILATLE